MNRKKILLILFVAILAISFFCFQQFTKQSTQVIEIDETTPSTTPTSTTEATSEPIETEETEDEMLMYKNSDFIEKEQPALTEETKKLISSFQKDPTKENFFNLRNEVIKNYEAVLTKKEDKLAELKEETSSKLNGSSLVSEMEEIVQEMYDTYWIRINSTMLRFSDDRLLKWNISNALDYDYVPVMGAGETIYIKTTPVTNKEYAEFIQDAGYPAPSNWENGTYPEGEDNYPVNFVSYEDALAYCNYLNEQDDQNTYRLPTESEWELAAGHMPKDADFNCGVNGERTSVFEYSDTTRGAHGAIDFWGNVWEWTSSSKDSDNLLEVKGGAYNTTRNECRTEYRNESRNKNESYEDVGFRVIQVKNGIEPELKIDSTTLDLETISDDMLVYFGVKN